MASEKNERDLIKKRSTIKSKLTTFIKFVDLCEESEKPSLKQLQIRIARIEKDVEEFELVQSALEQLASDDDYDTRLAERSAFEDAFCENLARAQELVEGPFHFSKRDQVNANRPTRVYSVMQATCYLCKGKHTTQACPKLTGSDITQRIAMVTTAGLCNNCLRPNHIAKHCYASTCKRCKAKHHTLLHQEQNNDQQPAVQANLAAPSARMKSEVLLYTVLVNIKDSQGRPHPCRIILDSGSQAQFLTERMVNKLELPREKTNETHLRLDLDDAIKALGIGWNANRDIIIYTLREFSSSERVTKRSTLSQIATLFDPLGLLGPISIRAKILMQGLWKLSLHWDESVPIEVHTKWHAYCRELSLLHKLKIKRQVTSKEYRTVQLHGFCDASEQAYGACLYLRSVDEKGNISSHLISSKSRVAPLKTVTLPRLELCAAHLLSKLFKVTIHALRKLTFERIIFWSDSTIALHWVKTSPHTLKTFVSHRVAEIQTATDPYEWRHVRSVDNPADLISRGISVQDFINNEFWYHGPSWLKNSEDQWPALQLESIQIPEVRPLIHLNTQVLTFDIWERYSSFTKLKRVVTYILRFYFNSSRKENQKGILSVYEFHRAQLFIIKTIQQFSFKTELHALNASGQITGNLGPLAPFIDANGILRVGGRLSRANIAYNAKHPILLPKNHAVTELIVREYHIKNFHAGIQATLNAIRLNFWIPNGKSVVRKIIHTCVTCYRAKPPIIDYRMGDLPSPRVTFSRPFLQAGVDFCGPIWIKEKTQRNRGKVKVYIAIFVCFTTKATHIEIVGDLSTEAFLAALRRFFARRGRSSDIYSDNATNFVGARREIKELFALFNSRDHNEKVTAILANEGINWHFIPPRAPHFGGLWEAAVRSVKHHLTRVIGDTLLSYEALLTYVNQIEAILNSRPITPVSSDPNDLTALTPAHFLIGESLTSIPDHDFTAIPSGRLSSWQHVQKMRAHFWKRWYKDYLQEQTVRKKWHTEINRDIPIGTVVILREDNTPPMTWPLGRITAVHPGDDGIIRVVTVKTANGEYKRCVKRIAPLPIEFVG